MSLKRILQAAAYNMRGMAEGAGLGYITIREWASGKRTPSPASRLRLARAFRAHAARLEELAAELEESVPGAGSAHKDPDKP